MRSFVRLAAVLGIVGSTLLGPALAGKMSALALPEQQVLEKLQSIPVFTITNREGIPLVASIPKEGQGQSGNASVTGIFISQRDAQAFIDQLKAKNPQLASSVQVTLVPLSEVYKMSQANQGKPDEVVFSYVPTQQQVELAKTVLRQSGEKDEFAGVPIFYATGGADNGLLTIQANQNSNEQIIPMFFNKEDLQKLLERFKQQEPSLASSIKIQVTRLEEVIETLRTGNDPSLQQIQLVPSRETLEFVRSLQQQGGSQPPRPQTQPPAPQPRR